MKESFKIVTYPRQAKPDTDLSAFSLEQARKARDFHASFDVYAQTPLTALPGLAKALGVESIHVKDESYRFGLNAFKVLGGSYALGRYIAKRLGEDIADLPASRILSDEVRKRLGEVTFVTATDGNHGRGVAWTANRLGQHSVVYMPKGSAAERLANIRAEGADASITDLNYDDAVRLANRQAVEKGWVMVQDTAWEGYTDIPLWIMQGYTTMGYEIVQQLEAMGAEKPTHVFLQAGVGSMAGDVFGNAMLLSKHIKLIAAVNHSNIFIDPNPDTAVSFKERERLFKEEAGWAAYDRSLLSAGGAVYDRKEKSITLSAEACRALGTDKQVMSPDELVKVILKAPVDLIYFGGIGTYVKSTSETQVEAKDAANAACRIDASELRAKCIADCTGGWPPPP